MVDEWLIIAYIMFGLAFWLSMFMIIGPKMVIRRMERWIESGKIDKSMKIFMHKYGVPIMASMGNALKEELTNSLLASLRGNRGVLSKQIKSAQKDIAQSIMDNSMPLLGNIAKELGYAPTNPMMAKIIAQLGQPIEQKAQDLLQSKILSQMKSLNTDTNIFVSEDVNGQKDIGETTESTGQG